MDLLANTAKVSQRVKSVIDDYMLSEMPASNNKDDCVYTMKGGVVVACDQLNLFQKKKTG